MITEVAKGVAREEINVQDMMLPRNSLQAINKSDMKDATVKDVITSLQSYNLSHCLVVDRVHHNIRGVISSSDIARKLHLPLAINTKTSFKRLYETITDIG